MKQCKICNSDIVITKQISGYQEGSIFEINYCKSCNTSMAYPAVIDENLYNIIYKNIHKIDGYERYSRISKEIKLSGDPLHFLANQDVMYWAVNKFLSTYPFIEKANILEVGCGFGYLTYALKMHHLNVKGIDISSEAVKNAKVNYGDYYEQADVFQYAKNHVAVYDIVILTEVIEHITDITSFLECLLIMLKKGGKLVITTPNKSVFAEDNIWDTELPPIHFWWFSEKSFVEISKKLGVLCSFLDFTAYNKMNTDFTQSVFYKSFHRSPVISADGKVTNTNLHAFSKFKLKLKMLMLQKGFLNYHIFKRKDYQKNKANTLCAILTK